MTLSYQQARKDVFSLVDAAWNAQAGAIVGGSVPEMRYQGVEKSTAPDNGAYWARSSTQSVTTVQKGFRQNTSNSPVIFTTNALVFIQIFAPMKVAGSWAIGELLGKLGQCMFMASDTQTGVWFRNPRVLEINNDGTWYRWNVVSNFQFDQTKGD